MHPIYHITHLENLASIVAAGELCSDAERIRRGVYHANVGLTDIKQARLTERTVHCHPETKVGEYVPFYFCPRSIMLFVLYKGNRPGLTYQGGQRPIVHLVADMEEVAAWASAKGIRWAFSNLNAGSAYASFFADLGQVDKVNWSAVKATDFRDPVVKDGKQAEFLLHGRFPWELFSRVGVIDQDIATQVQGILGASIERPVIEIRRDWYF
jgi:hypothetical protein